MCDLKSLVNKCGSLNPPGISSKLYVVEADKIATFPALKPFSDTSPGDSVTLDGEIVLEPNTAWKTFDIITKTGGLKETLEGSIGSKAFKQLLEGVIPTTSAASLEWIQCMANACFVIGFKEKSGQFRIIGNKDIPAYMDTAEIDTGKETGDTRGATFGIGGDTGLVASVYEGTFDLDATT